MIAVQKEAPSPSLRFPYRLAIASGKGGVGKTSVSINLAIALQKSGRQVSLIDADLGLANVDIALGLRPRYDLSQWLSGQGSLNQLFVEGPFGLKILPAVSGCSELASLDEVRRQQLLNQVEQEQSQADFSLMDVGAGVDPVALGFAASADQVIVVVTDTPTSLADSYALIKILNRERSVRNVQILANMTDQTSGIEIYNRLSQAAERFLDLNLGFLGSIPRDDLFSTSLKRRRSLLETFPKSEGALALKFVAEQVDKLSGNRNSSDLETARVTNVRLLA